MTRQNPSYNLGIDAARMDLRIGATIDSGKSTLIGYPVIPGRHRALNLRLAIVETSFWAGYKAGQEAAI